MLPLWFLKGCQRKSVERDVTKGGNTPDLVTVWHFPHLCVLIRLIRDFPNLFVLIVMQLYVEIILNDNYNYIGPQLPPHCPMTCKLGLSKLETLNWPAVWMWEWRVVSVGLWNAGDLSRGYPVSHGWMGGWISEWMVDGWWMDGWMHGGWVDRQVDWLMDWWSVLSFISQREHSSNCHEFSA